MADTKGTRFDTEFFERNYGLAIRPGWTGRYRGKPFIVVGQDGPYLSLWFKGETETDGRYHPTWEIEWDAEFLEVRP